MAKFPELPYDFKIYFSNDTSSNFDYSGGSANNNGNKSSNKKDLCGKIVNHTEGQNTYFSLWKKSKPVKDNTETVPRDLLQKKCSANLHPISRRITMHCVKNNQIRSFFGPYFAAFGLNTGK